MKVTIKLAATLLCAGVLSGEANALNLTPLRIIISSDGPAQPRYYFQDADKRLGFRIDSKMTVTGSSEVAIFHFTDVGNGTMRLLKSPAPAGLLFDPKGVESYQTVARALLPGGATNIQLLETIPDAISINGWKSVQFIYTYEFFGLPYQRAITFLNFRENEQFVFDLSASAADYGKIYSRGYRVLNSFFDLPLNVAPGPT
jgi:hypothetical protein